MMLKQTFKELAATWKYYGLTSIEFEFINRDYPQENFIRTVENLLKHGSIDEAEGYMVVILKKATVPNVVEYTLSGR